MQEFMRKIPRISALTARECPENDAFSGRIFERIGKNIAGFLKEFCGIYGRILRDFFVEKIKKFISPISFFFYFLPPLYFFTFLILFYLPNNFSNTLPIFSYERFLKDIFRLDSANSNP